jgi:hypothetical protein
VSHLAGRGILGRSEASRRPSKTWRSTVKWLYSWWTIPRGWIVPMSSPVSSRSSRRAHVAAVSPGSIFPPGNSQSPPSRPPSCRGWTSQRPRHATATTAAWWWGRGGARRWTGRTPGSESSRCARQSSSTGHSSHRGAAGRQTVSPSSMIASLNGPADAGGWSASRRAPSRRRTSGDAMSPRSRVHRAATRSPFASNATTGRPNAREATARAMYGPTPGSVSRPATSSGRCPSWSRTTSRAAAWRFRARA